MSFINENQLISESNELNTSDNSNSVKINHENCYDLVNKKFWCKGCVPRCIIEGWTSGNDDIDNFIKSSIYNAHLKYIGDGKYGPSFLEWVPFDRFEDMKQIGEGGFAKVYSATWIDGIAEYIKQDDENWIKRELKSNKVALKRLNESQNMSADFLNELKTHWKLNRLQDNSLRFYGITRDPETEEIMMIMQHAKNGNLRNVLSSNFDKILWCEKIGYLYYSTMDLKYLHELGYFHKDFHSGNILNINGASFISDFGLSGPSNEQKLDNKIYGVLPYIAPEVLNGEPYALSSDIYSFGVVMAELSSGKPPFYKRKHDSGLALEICNGLRPEFGKGTPEIYKKLAYRCMNANPNQRPTANELYEILECWKSRKDDEKYGYKGEEVRIAFEEADKEIPNISALYEKDPDAIYTSRAFTFKNLSKPINSSSTYLNEEDGEGCQDSQLVDLEISSSLKLKDDDVDN
ncbi:uncharacterized protein OCT59_011794 [Rhizophagus irregularis]|uniref:Cdc15p n=2 Tax=Rhizophagus irregularis TaxID=588596 RepID=A0A015KWE9_RHIIW|nr:Cdc15p [Rhizophagus irregularis DAOM 197198w]EXX70976.1 Cdc15p [Rhizophagus irregularis DAOM 197198w]UZO00674.1 hypothetical protein OCT59_011794 [Rhizophagus irregularis]